MVAAKVIWAASIRWRFIQAPKRWLQTAARKIVMHWARRISVRQHWTMNRQVVRGWSLELLPGVRVAALVTVAASMPPIDELVGAARHEKEANHDGGYNERKLML